MAENPASPEEIKNFVQNAAELLTRQLTQTRNAVIYWLGVIAVIALASADQDLRKLDRSSCFQPLLS
jgi:hypothetical protein